MFIRKCAGQTKLFSVFSAIILGITGGVVRGHAQAPAVGLHYGSDYATSQYEAFGSWLGKKVMYRVIFADKTSWSTIANPGFLSVSKSWVNSAPGRVEVISMPLFANGDTTGKFSLITSGARDQYFRSFASKVQAAGIADKVIIRLAWEANGDWYSWSYLRDPAGFKAAFRHAVYIMRTAAPKLRFEFCISNIANRGTGGAKWTAGYPGDDVVDVISMDIYDHWNTWDRMVNGDGGLAEMRSFAIQHNKPEAYAEWSCSTTKNGHGDNPAFISNMSNWMSARAGKVLYQAYWNTESGANAVLYRSAGTIVPKAAAMYKDQFGPADASAPKISEIADRSMTMNTTTGPIPFTISDAQTAATSLTLIKNASDQSLVPLSNITFGGSGSNRTVTIRPVTNKTGSSTIWIKVSDGKLTKHISFVLTVNAGLSYADVGAPAIKGSNAFEDGTVRMYAGGYDIYNKDDEFNFGYRSIPGDAEMTVRVASLRKAHEWTKAGLMFRGSLASNSAFVGVFVSPDNGVALQWRSVNGGGAATSPMLPGSPPEWIRLLRTGNSFYAFSSANGVEWDLVEAVNVSLPSGALGGLALTSHHTAVGTIAEFDSFGID